MKSKGGGRVAHPTKQPPSPQLLANECACHKPLTASTCGRAELLQALWLAERHQQQEHGLALAAGYLFQEEGDSEQDGGQEQKQEPPKQAPAQQEKNTLAEQSQPVPSVENPAQTTTANLRARFWEVTERITLQPSQAFDSEQAKLPLNLDEIIADGSLALPPKPTIVNKARLMPAAKRNLQSTRLGGLDVGQLVAQLSEGKRLRRLPRKQMRGWVERLLLVLDISAPLAPYREDIAQLVTDLQHWIGTDKLQVRVIADERYPAGRWLHWDGDDASEHAPDWQALGAGRAVLIVSELGIYAQDGGHGKQAWAGFLHLLRKQGTNLQVWCPLPLGEAEEVNEVDGEATRTGRVLPPVPVVHWSAASNMRRHPLPQADLHRSPARLRIAEEMCNLLSCSRYIEPRLLRHMRPALGSVALDAGLEQLVWQHPALSGGDHARSILRAQVGTYQQGLRAMPFTKKRQALHIMLQQHRQHNPLLAHVECLTWAAQMLAGDCVDEDWVAEKSLVAQAQSVVEKLAYDPSQRGNIIEAEMLVFMHGFTHGADERTRAYCSASMSKMMVAWHRAKNGDEALQQSLVGLRESDVAAALGTQQQAVTYWLGIDNEHGWLRLFGNRPEKRYLLNGPMLFSSVAIEMEGKVRRITVNPFRDIGVARLPWGELEAYSGERTRHLFAPETPPLVDGPIYLEAGSERLKIEEIERPWWALEWGRDRNGLYALMPDPWMRSTKHYFLPKWKKTPIYEGHPSVLPLLAVNTAVKKKNKSTPRKKPKAILTNLSLACDEIGPYATFTVSAANGEHSQTLRYIPPGQFLMGSPKSEERRYKNEGPQHQVRISEGFWMADTTCTQGLWQAIMGENPSRFKEESGRSARLPVENVSWEMAQEFLQNMAQLLPDCTPSLATEAEWEYACRAGTTTPFSFGETISTDQVNYRGNAYGKGLVGGFRGRPVAVKDLPANRWGLFQMHGNVWEWCLDAPRQYTTDAVLDPGLGVAFAKEDLRALRGGGWFDNAQFVRAAYRFQSRPVRQGDGIGFRFVLRSSIQAGRG